jgi:hypothetical protein
MSSRNTPTQLSVVTPNVGVETPPPAQPNGSPSASPTASEHNAKPLLKINGDASRSVEELRDENNVINDLRSGLLW